MAGYSAGSSGRAAVELRRGQALSITFGQGVRYPRLTGRRALKNRQGPEKGGERNWEVRLRRWSSGMVLGKPGCRLGRVAALAERKRCQVLWLLLLLSGIPEGKGSSLAFPP